MEVWMHVFQLKAFYRYKIQVPGLYVICTTRTDYWPLWIWSRLEWGLTTTTPQCSCAFIHNAKDISMWPRDEVTTYLPEMVALAQVVTSEAYLPHPAISTLLTFSSSPHAFLQSPPSSCDLSQQAISSSDYHNRFAMPHHDSNLGTVLSWGMDLSAVYFFFLMS